jgi:hypothetical protein
MERYNSLRGKVTHVVTPVKCSDFKVTSYDVCLNDAALGKLSLMLLVVLHMMLIPPNFPVFIAVSIFHVGS